MKTPWTTKDAILYDSTGQYVGKTKEYGIAATPEQITRAEIICIRVNGWDNFQASRDLNKIDKLIEERLDS